MQTGQRIYKDCNECYATGKQWENQGLIQSQPSQGSNEVDCPTCEGLGIYAWGWLRDEKETTMPGEEA